MKEEVIDEGICWIKKKAYYFIYYWVSSFPLLVFLPVFAFIAFSLQSYSFGSFLSGLPHVFSFISLQSLSFPLLSFTQPPLLVFLLVFFLTFLLIYFFLSPKSICISFPAKFLLFFQYPLFSYHQIIFLFSHWFHHLYSLFLTLILIQFISYCHLYFFFPYSFPNLFQ